MSNKQRYRRRKYFIKNSTQSRLILKTYIVLAVVLVLVGTLFYIAANKNLEGDYFKAHLVLKTTMDNLLPILIAVNGIALILAAFLIVRFTHRIAGPVYRLRKMAPRIAEGDLSRELKFRQSDEAKEIAEAVNQIIAGLRQKIIVLKQDLGNVSSMCEEIFSIGQNEPLPSHLLQVVKELHITLKSVNDNLEKFKVN
ncbi:MAG: methyl-accepting chemotaxis protein [Nitrospirae bacterium]|nr:methyl-accepting chemotaxis protein [Nitrospirota bacterium]